MTQIPHILKQACIPKEALDIMLCHFMKRMMVEKKSGAVRVRPHFRVVRVYKGFRMKNQVILISPCGKALCLLKTQFAKKPKNPV